jgi:hypothetical protein
MPKLNTDDDEMTTTSLGGNFAFSATQIEKLTETQYTLATVLVDVTYSTKNFANDLREVLKTSVLSLKKSPNASNLLVRVVTFSTFQGIKELHGFKQLSKIDLDAYPTFKPDGNTNLFDATWEAVEATRRYGQELKDNDFLANAIIFVITDGEDNSSKVRPSSIKQVIEEIRLKEVLESLLVILIGVNDSSCKNALDNFEREADLDGYKSAGEATAQNLAKLGRFVSESTSSTSNALNSGGASKQISATI